MRDEAYALKQGYKPLRRIYGKYKDPLPKNVVITSTELGGVGWFTSVISEVHDALYPKLPSKWWKYEASRFEATRFRRPLPTGWINCWNADPKILVERGFDKVILLQKELTDAYYGMAIYMYPDVPIDKIKEQNPRFFDIIKRKWEFLEQYRDFKHENFMYVHFNDLNNHTVKSFNELFDFLEFKKRGRPKIIPVKVWRNWECYSNILKSGGEWFETYDPLFKIKQDFSRNAMIKEFYEKDIKMIKNGK